MKILALIAFMASCATCAPAFAQQIKCYDTNDVYNLLTEKHGETRQVWAQTSSQQIIEFWGGANGWTVFITTPEGKSCLVAEGQDWGATPSEKRPQL